MNQEYMIHLDYTIERMNVHEVHENYTVLATVDALGQGRLYNFNNSLVLTPLEYSKGEKLDGLKEFHIGHNNDWKLFNSYVLTQEGEVRGLGLYDID